MVIEPDMATELGQLGFSRACLRSPFCNQIVKQFWFEELIIRVKITYNLLGYFAKNKHKIVL